MTTEMDTEIRFTISAWPGSSFPNTLSDNGGVTRGVCSVDANGYLQRVTETYEIQMKAGVLTACDEQKQPVSVSEDQHVSMNMWGLPPRFLEMLEAVLPDFWIALGDDAMKAEYLLPKIIDKLLAEKKARVKVLETGDRWFGVTYKEDKQVVVDSIQALIQQGVYKEKLF